MRSEFRSTSPQDMAAVAAFLQRIFEIDPGLPLIEPRHLNWKNWEERSDWPGSRGYVMTKEGAFVAHGTVIPLTGLSGSRRLRMLHLIDWAADPKSVGSGVTLLRHIARMVDVVLVAGGSEMTQKVLPALGFKPCGEVTKFARPLRPLRRIAGQKLSVRTGAQFARSLLWSLQAPQGRAQGWSATRIASEQLGTQAVQLPHGAEGISTFERTADSVAYLLRCPVAPMELYSVAENGTRRGYFILTQVPGQVRIADFHVDSDDPRGWRALIQLAVSQARRNRAAAEVVALGSDTLTRQVLADCGFHARGSSVLRLLPGPGVRLPEGPIRFQMVDSDAAYLHDNRNSYWA